MIKHICLVLGILCFGSSYSQEESNAQNLQKNKSFEGITLDVHNFYGTVLKHNPDISHLITGHPAGILVAVNQKTFGNKTWQRLYNYPDYGVSFLYQNMDNQFLGEHYGLYAHYNFYFLKRLLTLKLGQGLAYNTSPYDEDTNFRNIAYGSHILSSTYAFLNVQKENIIRGFGLQAGLGIIHYSNANFKAPNKSTNTFTFNIGVNYMLDADTPEYVEKEKRLARGAEPLSFGFIIRGGSNESDLVGSGQYPFYTFAAFADKRLNKKSALQLGAEVFFSKALDRFIDFRAAGGFNDGVTGDEDSKRVGIYIGHELRLHKTSILTQLGYYVYYPYDFEGRMYNRVGLQYYFTKNIFGSASVRSHAAKAEAVEFSIGYRL